MTQYNLHTPATKAYIEIEFDLVCKLALTHKKLKNRRNILIQKREDYNSFLLKRK